MYAMTFLGIPVVAWLTDDEITLVVIANDNGYGLPVLFLSKVAYATLELFIVIMDYGAFPIEILRMLFKEDIFLVVMKLVRELDLDPSSREWWIVLFVPLNVHIYRAGIRDRIWSDIKRSEYVKIRVVLLG